MQSEELKVYDLLHLLPVDAQAWVHYGSKLPEIDDDSLCLPGVEVEVIISAPGHQNLLISPTTVISSANLKKVMEPWMVGGFTVWTGLDSALRNTSVEGDGGAAHPDMLASVCQKVFNPETEGGSESPHLQFFDLSAGADGIECWAEVNKQPPDVDVGAFQVVEGGVSGDWYGLVCGFGMWSLIRCNIYLSMHVMITGVRATDQ